MASAPGRGLGEARVKKRRGRRGGLPARRVEAWLTSMTSYKPMIRSCRSSLRMRISCSTVFFRFCVYSLLLSIVFIATSSPVSTERTSDTSPKAPLPSTCAPEGVDVAPGTAAIARAVGQLCVCMRGAAGGRCGARRAPSRAGTSRDHPSSRRRQIGQCRDVPCLTAGPPASRSPCGAGRASAGAVGPDDEAGPSRPRLASGCAPTRRGRPWVAWWAQGMPVRLAPCAPHIRRLVGSAGISQRSQEGPWRGGAGTAPSADACRASCPRRACHRDARNEGRRRWSAAEAPLAPPASAGGPRL